MASVAPSVLAADFTQLGDEIASINALGIELLHLDIMDGHFVPNISFGPGIVGHIDRLTDAFLDVHLMLSEPERYYEAFARAGADSLTIHIEVHPDPRPQWPQIRQHGCRCGLSLNPSTPVDDIVPFLDDVDFVLVMSVEPGFGGQSFLPVALDKIREVRQVIAERGLSAQIQVDGGVSLENAGACIEAGADILIMGTQFFRARERKTLLEQIDQLASAREG